VQRELYIDDLRTAVTVAVVAHHSALAYNTFCHYNAVHYTLSSAPIVDSARFPPLDYFVAWNDIFFMALMFLISGLFVSSTLARKGAASFLADRTRRLGIPWAIAVVVLMPLAHYPSWRLSQEAPGGHFLLHFYTVDGWPVGPPWFIWMLLAFCALAARTARRNPQSWLLRPWPVSSPWALALVTLAVTLLAAIPLRLLIPPFLWLPGPLGFQLWRPVLYLAWFFLGVRLGAAGLSRTLSRDTLHPWPLWLLLGLAAFAAHWHFSGPALAAWPAWQRNVVLAAVFSCCCTFTALGSIGLFRACVRRSRAWTANLSANAYGIYIVHYGFVTWAQFLLLSSRLPAAAKFSIVFSSALAASWLVTAALRRTSARRLL
jgi:hypothetical protein